MTMTPSGIHRILKQGTAMFCMRDVGTPSHESSSPFRVMKTSAMKHGKHSGLNKQTGMSAHALAYLPIRCTEWLVTLAMALAGSSSHLLQYPKSKVEKLTGLSCLSCMQ
mmetsp:Transcript_81107/g.153988  ORF Transcript_81107/g.153988 Transcript_81107/m.153988 type:complete len:109 (-) Transcript_81107:801-1127(-)